MNEISDKEFDKRIKDALENEYIDSKVSAELKNSTLSAIKAKRVSETPQKKTGLLQFHRRRRTFSLIAAAMSLLLIGGTGTVAYASEAAYVSVESNASIGLKINYFSRVIQATASDGDSQELLDSVDILNKPYNEALETLTEAAPQATVDVIVSSTSTNRANKLTSGCSSVLTQTGAMGFCEQMSHEERELADEEDMSMGTYKLYTDLTDAGVEITADEARDLSHHQLRNMMMDCDSEYNSTGQNNTMKNGMGMGNCNSSVDESTLENETDGSSETGQSGKSNQSGGSTGGIGAGNGGGMGSGSGMGKMS